MVICIEPFVMADFVTQKIIQKPIDRVFVHFYDFYHRVEYPCVLAC